jgi:hypothetical protein
MQQSGEGDTPCPLHHATAATTVTAPVMRRVGRVGDLALLGARGQRQHNEERGEPSVPVHRATPAPAIDSNRLGSLFLTLPTRGPRATKSYLRRCRGGSLDDLVGAGED